MMASPLSSPELHRHQSTSTSQLASSLGNSMSKPQSTFNRFDEIDIPPYELSDNMISILEKPLGKAAQRAYALSSNASQKAAHAQDGSMLSVPTASGGAAQTGALMGGKSGAKHEEFGFCMNQNWRYTSQYDPKAREAEELQPPYYILLTTYFR
ncbi:serine palmitoyltransferase component [Naganishia albida]|nr:serine palmitoyltransferase component [Naganishia albida]